jgi:hypothetical protein
MHLSECDDVIDFEQSLVREDLPDVGIKPQAADDLAALGVEHHGNQFAAVTSFSN